MEKMLEVALIAVHVRSQFESQMAHARSLLDQTRRAKARGDHNAVAELAAEAAEAVGRATAYKDVLDRFGSLLD